MNIIQKISIALVIIVSELSCLTAAPNRQSSSRSTSHAGGEQHTAAKGATAHSNRNQPNQAAVGGAAIARTNNQDAQQSDSLTSPATSPSDTQTSSPDSQSSDQRTPLTQNFASNSNKSQNPGRELNQLKKSDDNSPQFDKQTETNSEKQEIENANDSSTEKEKQTLEDLKTIPSDQEEILEQIKTINLQDSATHSLLTMASMDQLFNNFVYFKEFIVKNFEKNKMLRLAIEFINQIYEKENIPTITLKSSTTPSPDSKNSVNPVPTPEESTPQATEPTDVEYPQYDELNNFNQAEYEEYLASQAAQESNGVNPDEYNQSYDEAAYDQSLEEADVN